MIGYYQIEAYNISINIPFICQKCGNCCYPFGKVCEYLDLNTRLCKIYEKRPNHVLLSCVGFPLHVDSWWSYPIEIGCKGFLRSKEIIKNIFYQWHCTYKSMEWIKEKIPESSLQEKKNMKDKLLSRISGFKFTDEEREIMLKLNPCLREI